MVVEPLAGGAAVGVGEDGCAFEDVGLLEVVLRHGDAPGGGAGVEGGDLRGVAAEGEGEGFGYGFAGEVVFGGAEAAHEDENVDAAEGGVDGVDEVFAAVADDGFEGDGDSDFVEFSSEIEGVSVLAGGGEHLGADGDDFRFHKSRDQGSGVRGQLLKQIQAFYTQVHIINGFVGGEDGGAQGGEGYADQIGTGEDEGGFALGGDADQATATVEAGGEVDVAIFGEGEALGRPRPRIPGAGFAMGVDGPDGVVGGEGRGGNEEGSFGVDGEVIGGDAGLECGVDEDLALGIDFEDGAAAVADEEVALGVKGQRRWPRPCLRRRRWIRRQRRCGRRCLRRGR